MAMTNKEWTKHTTEAVAAESSNRLTTPCPQPSPTPALTKSAGVVAFITPDGLTVIRFAAWTSIVRRAAQLCKTPAEFAAYLRRKANELEARFGWLKRLWAARLQRVLRRLALQRGLPQRWDGKDSDLPLDEALDWLAALFVLPKEYRAPPDKMDAPLMPLSPLWSTPAIPRSLRAPNCAALRRRVGGCVVLHAA